MVDYVQNITLINILQVDNNIFQNAIIVFSVQFIDCKKDP